MMKQLQLFLSVILLFTLLFTACTKEMKKDKVQEEMISLTAKNRGTKIEICHKGHTISINSNAWPAHQAHGDAMGSCSVVLTTTICDQIWMVKNLDVATYRNGDPIPQVTDPAEWAALTTGAWCYYMNDPAYGAIFGKLYNKYAVQDSRGLAPTGWHVASYAEWDTLINCLGGKFVAGAKLKDTGTTYWKYPNLDATNEAGFTALPGNQRSSNGRFEPGRINPFLGVYASFWTSTFYAAHKDILYHRTDVQDGTGNPNWGFSVRCVKDQQFN